MDLSIKSDNVIARSEATKQSVPNYLRRLLHPDESGFAMTIIEKVLEKLNDNF